MQEPESCSTGTSAEGESRPISFCAVSPSPGALGGLVVVSVDKLSSPGKAGIIAGDEILSIAGEKVTSLDEAMQVLHRESIGAMVGVRVVRDRAEATIEMTVEARVLTLDLDDLDEVVERKIAPAA